MLTWKHYLRPYNTIKRLVMLADARLTLSKLSARQFESLQKITEHLQAIVESQKTLITLKDAEITRLKKDYDLLDAHLVNTVDQVHRDGIEPPEPKKYLN